MLSTFQNEIKRISLTGIIQPPAGRKLAKGVISWTLYSLPLPLWVPAPGGLFPGSCLVAVSHSSGLLQHSGCNLLRTVGTSALYCNYLCKNRNGASHLFIPLSLAGHFAYCRLQKWLGNRILITVRTFQVKLL